MSLGHTTGASMHNDHMSMPKTCDARRGNFRKIRGVLQKRPVRPCFGASEAYTHFATITKGTNSRYNTPENSGPLWIDEVMPSPDPEKITLFDLSAITPGSIKRVLVKRSSNSSPGDDGITYHYLKKMPYTHHFLATLFSNILLDKYTVPESWCEAKIKLVFKGGDDCSTANFHPIVLASAVGKLYHNFIALRLERLVLNSKIIDKSLKEVFFNRHQRHNGAHCFIISYHTKHLSTRPTTRYDLPGPGKCLQIHLPWTNSRYAITLQTPTRDYYLHCRPYAKPIAYVKTKEWSTDKFKIGRGVLQGDTRSPLIFLITFNPIN